MYNTRRAFFTAKPANYLKIKEVPTLSTAPHFTNVVKIFILKQE